MEADAEYQQDVKQKRAPAPQGGRSGLGCRRPFGYPVVAPMASLLAQRSGVTTFGAILGVKDEVEIVRAAIAHLRRIGVAAIVACDYGSTDGTIDAIEAERRDGGLRLVHVDPDVVVDYATQSEHDLALAREIGTDWVISLDADEFWIPASGSLHDCTALDEADIVVVPRYNVPLTATHLLMPADLVPATYDSLQLLTREVPHRRAFVEGHPDEPFITVAPCGKAIMRPGFAQAIAPGSHDVHARTPDARRVVAADLLVAHVAFSTWERFERKVRNIRDEMMRHPALFEGDYAWHWRRWAEMNRAALEAEFERQVASPATLQRWRNDGFLQSAQELLAPPAARAHDEERWWAGGCAAWRRLWHRPPVLRSVQPILGTAGAGRR
jgi:hypothetical protein